MEIILSILAVLFIGLLLATAFTFGLAILVIFSGILIASLAYVLLRDWWRRWRITHGRDRADRANVTIIEAQYTEIHDEDKR